MRSVRVSFIVPDIVDRYSVTRLNVRVDRGIIGTELSMRRLYLVQTLASIPASDWPENNWTQSVDDAEYDVQPVMKSPSLAHQRGFKCPSNSTSVCPKNLACRIMAAWASPAMSRSNLIRR